MTKPPESDGGFDSFLREVARLPQGEESAVRRLVGQRLGRFLLEARLGTGGMGVVYRALDESLGRRVAIKVLHPNLPAPLRRELIQREARLAAALTHPNIATVHELGEAEGLAFGVFEWVDGITLREVIQQGALTLERCAWLALQLARALASVHGQRLFHGDVKPENAMVTADGTLKLLDFGLGSYLPLPTDKPTRVGGTTGYLSPEQLAGEPPCARTDVFAFGCVLGELVAVTDARTSAPQLRALKALAERAASPDAAARPADGEALVVELTRATAPRAPRKAALAGAGLVLLGALGLAAAWLRRPPGVAAVAPTPHRVLLSSKEDIEDAYLSPDGTRVAFGDRLGIHVQDLSGRDEVLGLFGEEFISPASWLPTGRSLLAFVQNDRELSMARVDLGPPASLSRIPSEYLELARVSPDGTRFAGIDTNRHLRVYDLKGRLRLEQVPAVEGYPWALDWSPDSRFIAAGSVRGRSVKDPHTVTLYNATTGKARQLWRDAREPRHNSWCGLVWLPDGRIVFSYTHDAQLDGTQFSSVRVDGEGQPLEAPVPFAHLPGVAAMFLGTSSAGDKLLYVSSTPQYDVHTGALVDSAPALTELTRLTFTDSQEHSVGFTREDNRLLFTSDRAGNYELYAHSLGEAPPELLASKLPRWVSVGPSLAPNETSLWIDRQGLELVRLTAPSSQGEWRLTPTDSGAPKTAVWPSTSGTFPSTSSCTPPDRPPLRCVLVEPGTSDLRLWRIDPLTRQNVDSVQVPYPLQKLRDVAISADGQSAYVAVDFGGPLLSYDFESQKSRTVPLPDDCVAIDVETVPNSSRVLALVWCTSREQMDGILSLDTATNATTWVWNGSFSGTSRLVVSNDGKRFALSLMKFDSKVWWMDVPN